MSWVALMNAIDLLPVDWLPAAASGVSDGRIEYLRPLPTARARRLLASGVRRLLAIAALPTMMTVATASVGWWDPENVTRAWFALPLGAAIAAVVAAVVAGDLR